MSEAQGVSPQGVESVDLDSLARQDAARMRQHVSAVKRSKHARDRGVWGYQTPKKNGRRK